MTSQVDIYCLNFENLQKKEAMIKIFKERNLTDVFFGKGVSSEDPRIFNYSKLINNINTKQIWSCCYGHLDAIHHFLINSPKEFGIFCEDDILITKKFVDYLPKIITLFIENKLDTLLLGYLCDVDFTGYSNFPEINTSHTSNIYSQADFPYRLFEYPDNVWGSQMFMISKKQACMLINKYYYTYAPRTLLDKTLTPFSADWTLTKEGKRALIYPLMVIENENLDKKYDNTDGGIMQKEAHRRCFHFSYSDEFS